MSNTNNIDYDALAKKFGAKDSTPDYDSLAKKYGATSSAPISDPKLAMNRALNASPTQFEIDRNPSFQQGWAPAAVDSAVGLAKSAAGGLGLSAYNDVKQGIQDVKDYSATGSTQAQKADAERKAQGRSAIYRAVAPAAAAATGVDLQRMEHGADVGNVAEIGGSVAVPLAAAVAPVAHEAYKGAARVAPSPRGILADRMAEVPPGEQFSRQQVLDAARANKVNLDLAQATDSGAAKAVKKANQYSLTGQGAYDKNLQGNLAALDEWASKESSKYSPESSTKEVVGAKLQEALKQNVNTRQTAAAQIFNDLDKNVGNVKPDATSIYDKAKQIVAENSDYYEKNPALKQSRAWQIVNDLASRAENTKPTTVTVQSKIVNESGTPFEKQITKGPEVKPDTWTDLQKLRTDLMSEYRSPDIVGSRAEGWLKQLTGEIDNSMTGAGSGLSGADLQKFRQANAIWESIKNTYDNPQNPMYHALRSPTPSQIPGMLSKGTPELARQVRATLGSLEGPFQRQFVENLLYAKDGQTLELGRLNQKLRGVSDEHLSAMIGKEGAKQLRLLGKVSQKVLADANPSGTAKVGQPAAELAGVFTHPVAAVPELGAQYVGAKAINSPKVVDYFTSPKK